MRLFASRVAPAFLLALACGACQSVEASAYNLDQLHEPDGRHRYKAALESDFGYFWRTFTERVLRKSPLKKPSEDAVENPSKECLEEVLDLVTNPAGHPTTRALQLSWCAHLALECPWKLSRERAVETLGVAAVELEVGVPRDLPPDVVPAGPTVVAEAIEGLTRAVRGTIEREGRSAAARQADLRAAADAARALTLDVEGARRALRASSELLRVTGLTGPSAEVLLALTAELEKRLVGLALARAQADKSAWVRAAALRAAVESGGIEALGAWIARGENEDPEVARAILELVIENGLPAPPSERGAREAQLAAVYAQIYRIEGPVRVRAMEALASLDDAPDLGLHEEDWQAWWMARTGSPSPRSGALDAPAAPPASSGAGGPRWGGQR